MTALVRGRRSRGPDCSCGFRWARRLCGLARAAPRCRVESCSCGRSAMDLARLPSMLDRVDAWIAAGDLGGVPATAADYQLAGSLRLLLTLEDLAPSFHDRPAGTLARRLI